MTVLLVDDQIRILSGLISGLNWQVLGITAIRTATSAVKAKEILLQEQIDILLCDIEMPGEDGIQLIRWVKEQNLDCECIFLTCHADFKYAHEAIKLGITDYVLLPARNEEIRKSVERAIQQRLQRHSHEEIYEYGQKWLDAQTEELNKKTGVRRTQEEIVQECINHIQAHLADPELSVNHLASELYMNRVYLNRIFKNLQKVSISQYIINERMKLAAQLLKKPSLTLNAVSEGVGYNSYSYFVAAFKKYYRSTPSQYRKENICWSCPGSAIPLLYLILPRVLLLYLLLSYSLLHARAHLTAFSQPLSFS